MPIYEAPSVFVTSPVFDPKKQDSGYSKLFQSDDTTYNQTAETMDNDRYSAKQDTTKTEADSESCWGMFKSREHFNAMHFS